MRRKVTKPITADVRVADTLDRLVMTPRDGADGHALTGLLRQLLPATSVHRSAEGTWVPSQESDRVLSLDEAELDLRWSLEATRFAENRQTAKRVHRYLIRRVKEVRSGGSRLAKTCLADIANLDPLDDHQLVNVAAMTIEDGFGLCVFDEQGTGKTVTLIFAFDVLVSRDEIDFVLIIAPKSMVAEWPVDFRRFKDDLYRVGVVTGTTRQKRTTLRSDADVLVTNFETTVSMEQELRAILRRHQGRAMIAVDESFYAKNLDAKRTRAVRRLREWCGRAYVLCGTPAPNAPHDLVQQFNLVDFGLTFDGVSIPEDRSAARPVVQRAIEERGLFVRHLKANVLPGLPVKRFHRVLVPLAPVQQDVYSAALRNLILDLQNTDDQAFKKQITSFLARRLALLQICSNPGNIIAGYSEVPTKLQALDGLLEEAIGKRREKVVVWSFFTGSLNAITMRYGQYHPVRYDGTVGDVTLRREAIRKFQEDDETMLFVGNPAAAGAGITIHRARLAVYESMSNQAAHYLQSLDRIHRRGQTKGVEYMILLCDRTIEVQEYDRLTAKERSAQALLGDKVEPPLTREAMLTEAIAAIKQLEA